MAAPVSLPSSVTPLPAGGPGPAARAGAARSVQVSEGLRRWRNLTSGGVSLLCFLAAVAVVTPLAVVFVFLVIKGALSLNWDFFTKAETSPFETGGGVAHAIIGSLLLVLLAALVSVPVGVLGGMFLTEYSPPWLASVFRFCADVLNGVPSIIWGIVGYVLFVLPGGSPFTVGFSALAGSAVLAFIMVPLILRTTEEVLQLVPQGYREAGLALGITRWKITLLIVARTALKGILTGVLLAVARVAGETAPLLFTAFGNSNFSGDLRKPIASLTLQIYKFATSPYDDQNRQAWAAALVLLLLVLTLNVSLRYLTRERIVREAGRHLPGPGQPPPTPAPRTILPTAPGVTS